MIYGQYSAASLMPTSYTLTQIWFTASTVQHHWCSPLTRWPKYDLRPVQCSITDAHLLHAGPNMIYGQYSAASLMPTSYTLAQIWFTTSTVQHHWCPPLTRWPKYDLRPVQCSITDAHLLHAGANMIYGQYSAASLMPTSYTLAQMWFTTSAVQHHWCPPLTSGAKKYLLKHKLWDCLFSRLFWFTSKKTSKLRVIGLCEGNSPVTIEFPAQKASNAEKVPIWWRHHGGHVYLRPVSPYHGSLARYVKLRVVHAPGMPGTFSPPPRVSYPDMRHGTCVMHVPRCMSGLLTSGFIWSRWRGKRSRHSRRMRTILRIF